HRRSLALRGGRVPIASVAVKCEYVLLSNEYDALVIAQSVNARQIALEHLDQRVKLCAHVEVERKRDEEVGDLVIHGAARILVEQCEGRREVSGRFVARIHAEAFGAG